MGWKCPTCRRHVYKSGKCPHCSCDYCDVCGGVRDPADIHSHHVSYELDVTIQVCDECHEKIHFPEKRSAGDNGRELDRLNPLATRGHG